MQRGSRAVLAFALCVVLAHAVIAQDPPRPADPFADPKHDPYNILRYIPNNILTGVSHSLLLIVAVTQLYLSYRYKTWWMLMLPISMIFFAEGLALRFIINQNPESRTLYIASASLVVLTPCFFIAINYMLLGRLARYLGVEKHLLVMPKRITKIFVASDVLTFMIQGSGSGLQAASDIATAKLGGKLFTVGLAIQLVSYTFFSVMYIVFLVRVRKHEPAIWNASRTQRKPWHADWRALAFALVVSCIGIMIRSIYRVAEGAQGLFGSLMTTEWIFYVFDTLPLFVAVAVYVPFWPGRYIPTPKAGEQDEIAHELHQFEHASDHGSRRSSPA